MAFQRKTLIWFLVIAVIIVVAAIVIYLFRCDIFKNLGSCVEDPNDTNQPIPTGSPTPKWVAETPPYNIGQFGPKIKALQKALGFSVADQDGKFGPQTASAVIAKGKPVPLPESDYQAIVNPAASGGGTNFQQVKTGLGTAGQNFSGGVFGYASGPNQVYSFYFYTNGRVFIYNPQQVEQARGTYTNGGKTIALDGGDSFTSNTVTLNMQKVANDLG